MGPVDRDAVRAFLGLMVPREAPGIVLLLGSCEEPCPRNAPLPWEKIERAAWDGVPVLWKPGPPGEDGKVHWVAVRLGAVRNVPQEAALSLMPALPAAVVAGRDCAEVHWRLHPIPQDEAAVLSEDLAALLDAAFLRPDEPRLLPLTWAQFWAETPPVVWTPAALASAASAAGRAGKAGQRPEQNSQLWAEACRALEALPQHALVGAVVETLLDGAGAEEMLGSLGVETIASIGGRLMALRDGKWLEIRMEPPRLLLAQGPGEFDV